MIQDNLISYGDLERLGWPHFLIEDYLGLKREISPQHGEAADPNGVFVSNRSKFYVYIDPDSIDPPGLWFNPVVGVDDGWIQIV